VVSAELRRLAQRRPDFTDDQRSEIAHAVHRVVQRLLHSPTVRARQLAAEPGGDQYTALLRELFDLDVPRPRLADDVTDISGVLPVAEIRPADRAPGSGGGRR
jgi:glutamyl-tRNA reductase